LDLLAAEASVKHLQQRFGPPDNLNAWRFLVASITYFQATPGGGLPMVPNLTDFTRLWKRERGTPGPLYPGAEAITERLANDFGVATTGTNWIYQLEKAIATYFRFRGWLFGATASRTTGRSLNNSQMRNTWVGDGFEQILYILTREYAAHSGVPSIDVKFKVPPEHIVGFQLRTGGGRQRFPVSDLAIANPSLRAVISAKVGLRVDRTRGELDAALTLSRVRPEARYLVVTSEYDTDLLQLLASEPTVGRVYHINRDYLMDFWSHAPGGSSRIPWILTSLGDLSDYFSDIVTLGTPAL
jgi:hypothetical protein